MKKTELTVLSFGAGQDSTALLYAYASDEGFRVRFAPGRFLVVFSDTGDEHPATYQHLQYVERFCREHGIEFVHLKPEMGFHSPLWRDLRSFYRRTGTCGSKAYRKSCTDNLKLKPIYRFLETYLGEHYGVPVGRKRGFYEFARRFGPVRMLIGLAAGEESRVAGSDPHPWRAKTVEKVYPLIELGWDRAACQAFIRKAGHPVPPPSNCMLCPYLSLQELLWLERFYPDDYREWVEIEVMKFQKFSHLPAEKNLGVWGRKLLPAKLEEAKRLYGHLSDADLHEWKFSHGHCVGSRY